MARHWLAVPVLAFALGATSLPARAQVSVSDTLDRTVLTGKYAYIAMPPQLVAEPVITDIAISNGRKYALLQRTHYTDLPDFVPGRPAQITAGLADISLIMWDAEFRRSSQVWHADVTEASITQVAWTRQAEIAYVAVRRTLPASSNAPQAPTDHDAQLLRIDPAVHRTEPVDLGPYSKADMLEIVPSTSGPEAMVRATRIVPPDNVTTVLLLNAHGAVAAHTDLPAGAFLAEMRWSEAGSPLLCVIEQHPSNGLLHNWFAMNPTTGQLTPVPAASIPKPQPAQAPPAASDPAPGVLALRQSRPRVTDGDAKPAIGLLWLESTVQSDHPRALISSDCSRGELLADGSQVLYQSQGAVWSTPLKRIDVAKYLAMKALAERMAAMQHAKQCGLALLMSAQDNGENLPAQGNALDSMSPYLNDPSTMAGFVYTYTGGPLSDIDFPAQTAIGYINGPGGQAVVYADGHVKWQRQ